MNTCYSWGFPPFTLLYSLCLNFWRSAYLHQALPFYQVPVAVYLCLNVKEVFYLTTLLIGKVIQCCVVVDE